MEQERSLKRLRETEERHHVIEQKDKDLLSKLKARLAALENGNGSSLHSSVTSAPDGASVESHKEKKAESSETFLARVLASEQASAPSASKQVRELLEARYAKSEADRLQLSEKLIEVGAECDRLRGTIAEHRALEKRHLALSQQHDLVLEMLGAKEEELQDRIDDIAEMKRMYRAQTEDLLRRLNAKT